MAVTALMDRAEASPRHVFHRPGVRGQVPQRVLGIPDHVPHDPDHHVSVIRVIFPQKCATASACSPLPTPPPAAPE
eukprot:2716458-Rhodomonas_salina.2